MERVELIYNKYVDNLESVFLYFNKFGKLASNEDINITDSSSKMFEDAYTQFQNEMNEIKSKASNTNDILKAKQSNLLKLAKKIKRNRISPKNYEILSNSSFLMLNNYFEYLLTDLLSYYYHKYSNSLNEREFRLTLKEISEYESIDEMKKDLIIKEVESLIIEKSFEDLLNHFENKLKIPLEKNLVKWENIIEIRERRHLIVHNSSKVNKKYILRTKNPYNLKIGDTVTIDKAYFINSLNTFKLAGYLLIFNCWGQWDKDKINEVINEIMIQSFDNLKVKNYDIVSKICKYASIIIHKNEEQEDCLLRIKINYALALKRMKNPELKEVLNSFNIGTATPIFRVAHKILCDNFCDIESEIKKAVVLEELNLEQYLDWPIFDEIREIEEIDNKVMKIFNKQEND